MDPTLPSGRLFRFLRDKNLSGSMGRGEIQDNLEERISTIVMAGKDDDLLELVTILQLFCNVELKTRASTIRTREEVPMKQGFMEVFA